MPRTDRTARLFARLRLSKTRYDKHGNVVPLDVDTAASRSQAYVYGNILVLAALASLSTESVASGSGALLVVGTAVSTFIAHVLSHVIGHQIRTSSVSTAGSNLHLRAEIRNAVPILTSGTVPAVILLIGLSQVLPPLAILIIADVSIVGRFLLLGSVLGSLSGKNSFVSLAAGVGLAIIAAVVAVIKILLTH